MAVENELVYIVRLNAKGESELTRVTRKLDETGEAVDETNEKVGRYSNTLRSSGDAVEKFETEHKSLRNELEAGSITSSEYADRIGQLKSELRGATAPLTRATGETKQLTRSQRRAADSTQKMTRSMGNNVHTSTAFLGIVQDSAFGIRGMANNIPFAIEAFSDLRRNTGSTGAALKGMLSFLTGPLGMTIAIASLLPWLGELTRGMDFFGDKTKYSKEQLGQLTEGIGELRGGFEVEGLFASTQADIGRLEEAIELAKERAVLQEEIDELSAKGSFAEAIMSLFGADDPLNLSDDKERVTIIEQIIRGLGFQSHEVDELNDKLEIQQALLKYYSGELGDEYIKKAAKVTLSTDAAALAVQKFNLGLINQDQLLAATSGLQQLIEKYTDLAEQKDNFIPFLDQLQQARSDVQSAIGETGIQPEPPTLGTPDIGPLPGIEPLPTGHFEKAYAATQKKIAQLEKQTTKRMAAQGQARLSMAQKIEDTRFQIKLQGTTRLEALELKTRRKIGAVKNNELITERQQQMRITQIQRNAKNARVRLAQMESEQKKAAIMGTAQMFSGQLQATFSDSKAIAVATGTTNAILAGINTRTKMAEVLPFPVPTILGAAMTALQMAQVAKMKQVSLKGGGGGGGQSATGYRGFSFGKQGVSAPAPDTSNAGKPGQDAGGSGRMQEAESREITITDGFGNMVARGQEDIDRRGGNNYLRGSNGST